MPSGKLIIAQVDHSTGEIIGHSIQKLLQIGARNVQLLQSITKKNRPGYVLFVDLPEDRVDKVATFLISELGIWGYHILDSRHVHFDVSSAEKMLGIAVDDHHAVFKTNAKYVAHNGQLLSIKVDHDQLVQIQQRLEEWGYVCPLAVLRSTIEAELWSGDDSDKLSIEINLKGLKREVSFVLWRNLAQA